MKVLYIASESDPFIKTGGLADVAASLPKALKEDGVDVKVVIPLYSKVKDKYLDQLVKTHEYWVDLDWKHQYAGVYEMEYGGVTYYFIDNEQYFRRANLYGEFDDAERFIYFSKAAVMLPKILKFKPDVIHSNDWHTGLVSAYVNEFKKGDDFYKDIKTLYTIHNLKYQGIFDPGVFSMTGLPGHLMNANDLEFNHAINFMKGGIVQSSKFNTVSRTYAEEIKYPFFGEGLEGVINYHSDKLSGIVNGIDYEVWDPKADPLLFENYSIENYQKRVENKKKLQEKYGLPVREDVLMISMVTRLTSMKGLELVRYVMDELLEEDIQLVILGTGDKEYEQMFKYFEGEYPEKMAARIYFDSDESHMIYGASDLFLMPSVAEPCGISQLIAMRYGALPVVRETGGLKDTVIPYNKYTKEGTGFSFANINAHELLFKIKDAIDLYYNEREDFNHLIENAMGAKNDWEESSKAYIDLYRSMM